jgi:hypothetical protein
MIFAFFLIYKSISPICRLFGDFFLKSNIVNIELCLYNINKYFENSPERMEGRVIAEFTNLGFGTDSFNDALNKIFSEKYLRELCIKDKKLAKEIKERIIDFIIETQKYIYNTDNQIENELDFIDRQLEIFRNKLYSEIESIRGVVYENFSPQ